MTAEGRLRLLLRIWMVVFALGAVDYLLFPDAVTGSLNSGHLVSPFPGATTGHSDFWLALAVGYMVLITLLAWDAQRGPRVAARPVVYLVAAKIASSLAALAHFLTGAHLGGFLAGFLVDGAIALVTYAFYRSARPALAA